MINQIEKKEDVLVTIEMLEFVLEQLKANIQEGADKETILAIMKPLGVCQTSLSCHLLQLYGVV